MTGTGLLALVGYGRWGTNIARQLSALAGQRWAYLVEPRAHRCDAFALRHPGVQITGDYDAVLADTRVAAVLLATPATTHAALALQALAAGKHVFVEKPMSLSVSSALELAGAAQAAGLILMVGHVFRYAPALQTAKLLIDRGDLGDILRIHCERLDWPAIDSDVDALWDLGPHDASIATHLLGMEPVTVTARQLQRADSFAATIEYPGGVRAQLHLSRRHRHRTRRVTIVGSRQRLVHDHLDAHQPITLTETDGRPQVPQRLAAVSAAEPLALEIKHYLDCLDGQTRPVTDGWEGVRTVALLEAAQTSWRQGHKAVTVRLPVEAQLCP
ncbi:MAG TPA: Gfo/Idh/MocA family oxidoreductase [Candidatus Limnocylindrales bacterium]|nr:Gfo/Idh/MocA family oxidoreductase [Candidatus Limnocylindrales bacterium]